MTLSNEQKAFGVERKPKTYDEPHLMKQARRVFLDDGQPYNIVVGWMAEPEAVLEENPPHHPEDWGYYYPRIGNEFVVEGPSDALDRLVTLVEAKKIRESAIR